MDQPVVVAAHTDIMGSVVDRYRVKGETNVFERRHADILRAGGVQVFCDHLGGDSRYGYLPATGLRTDPLQRALRLFDHTYQEEEESESLVIAKSIVDIENAVLDGKFAIILGMEGGSPLNGELAYLRAFHRLGLRSLGITHNWRNALADGCLERSGGGLTHFGCAVVAECNQLGIAIDVSHMSIAGVADTLELSSKPVIESHTNPHAVMGHPHNLPDEYLREIAESGGFVGVFFLHAYLTENAVPTIDDVLRVIDYLIELIGIEHVGLAPDIVENWNQAEFKAITESARTFESVPVVPINYEYPKGLSSIADLGHLRETLSVRRGLTECEISQLFGSNALRAYESSWLK